MPDEASRHRPEKSVTCVHCGSTDTEMIGLFGPFHLASQYFCRACHSPFGHMRWQTEKPPTRDDAGRA